MGSDRKKKAAEIQDAIRRILFEDWDPIGVAGFFGPEDEYDSYIGPVYRILATSAPTAEEDLVRFLTRVETEEMGLSPPDDVQLRRIARKLIALPISIRSVNRSGT